MNPKEQLEIEGCSSEDLDSAVQGACYQMALAINREGMSEQIALLQSRGWTDDAIVYAAKEYREVRRVRFELMIPGARVFVHEEQAYGTIRVAVPEIDDYEIEFDDGDSGAYTACELDLVPADEAHGPGMFSNPQKPKEGAPEPEEQQGVRRWMDDPIINLVASALTESKRTRELD